MVAQASLLYADVRDLAGLNKVVMKQLRNSLSTMRFRNIKVTILGLHGPDRARKIMRRGRRKKGSMPEFCSRL